MEQDTTTLSLRDEQKRARSALRLLLHYPAVTRSIDRFKRITLSGTDYIYNEKSENIIATIRRGDDTSTATLIRYRPASYYAEIIKSFRDTLAKNGSTVHAVPSTTIGRWQRTVARKARDTRTRSREEALVRLSSHLGYPLFDNLTYNREEMRRKRMEQRQQEAREAAKWQVRRNEIARYLESLTDEQLAEGSQSSSLTYHLTSSTRIRYTNAGGDWLNVYELIDDATRQRWSWGPVGVRIHDSEIHDLNRLGLLEDRYCRPLDSHAQIGRSNIVYDETSRSSQVLDSATIERLLNTRYRG